MRLWRAPLPEAVANSSSHVEMHQPYLRCANVLAPIQGSHRTAEPPQPSFLPGKLCSAMVRAVRQMALAAPAQGSPHGTGTRRCAQYASACRLAVVVL